MCVYSMILDHYNQKSVDYWQYNGLQRIQDVKDLVEKAKEYDVRTGQPNCEDPEKEKLLKRLDELEARLKALEAKPKRQRKPRGKPSQADKLTP